MKTAVAHLEPHMEKTDDEGKGTIVLATVKGDVHDIGKNLVDIILTNNGYTVVNLGIKQPVSAILERRAGAPRRRRSACPGCWSSRTVVMKENLEEMNSRGVADALPVHPRRRRADPRLRRERPRRGLRGRGPLRPGRVRGPAADGRHHRRSSAGCPARRCPTLRPRRVRAGRGAPGRDRRGRPAGPLRRRTRQPGARRRRSGAPGSSRASAGRLRRLPRRARHVHGPVGAEGIARATGPSYEELVETEGRPRLRIGWTGCRPRACSRRPSSTATSRASARATTWCVLDDDGGGARPGSPSRASGATGTCAWPTSSGRRTSGEIDVVALQVVTMGTPGREATGGAVRRERLPRLPGAARAVGAADRGAGGVLARPGARRARLRRRRRPDLDGHPPAGLPRLALLLRLPRLPRPGGPRQGRCALLDPERIGVELSEELQLHPEQSTDAIVVHHPEAKYFNAT